MGLSKSIPIFLDNNSGWDDYQTFEINRIAKTIRNSFESKAKQKKKDKPIIDKCVNAKYGRVLNLYDYEYRNYFNLQFILNLSGFETDKDYVLVEMTGNCSDINFEGSHSDTDPSVFLSSIGYIYFDYYNQNPALLFHCSDADIIPTDEAGNRVQYSVFVRGKIYD